MIINQLHLPEAATDVDKAHRIGPRNGVNQSIIVKFKSHEKRYAVYEKRSRCKRGIKINPSLTPKRMKLLERLNYSILSYKSTSQIENKHFPIDFAFANTHGDLFVRLIEPVGGKNFHGITYFEDFQDLLIALSYEEFVDFVDYGVTATEENSE